jgi:hypothetical protein
VRLRRLLVLPLCLALIGAAPEALGSSVLTRTRAVRAAYRLAQSVGAQQGAVYAIAGFCKRKSSKHVNCWAGIVWSDYSGAAQRVSVTLRGGKVRAQRFGRVYTGQLGQQQSGESGGEWAICGIHSSVCIGS